MKKNKLTIITILIIFCSFTLYLSGCGTSEIDSLVNQNKTLTARVAELETQNSKLKSEITSLENKINWYKQTYNISYPEIDSNGGEIQKAVFAK